MANSILINTLSLFGKQTRTERAAKALIRQARDAFTQAETEINSGIGAAQAMMQSAKSGKKQIASIPARHFEQSLWRYREAIVKFEQARKFSLSPMYKKYVDSKLGACFKNARICKLLQHKFNFQNPF